MSTPASVIVVAPNSAQPQPDTVSESQATQIAEAAAEEAAAEVSEQATEQATLTLAILSEQNQQLRAEVESQRAELQAQAAQLAQIGEWQARVTAVLEELAEEEEGDPAEVEEIIVEPAEEEQAQEGRRFRLRDLLI